MTYPLSSPVVPGQATEAAQYNNLRMDALYLGNDPAASGSVRDLLYSYGGTYSLTREGKTKIKLPASASAPVGLMIGGGIYSITETAELTLSSLETPNAGRYPVYANASGNSFELSLYPGDVYREIGSFCWDGSGTIPGTIHTGDENRISALIKRPAAASGRLSLAPTDPVPDTDITNGQTLYFLPYSGNEIGLYMFGEWEYFSFDPLNLSNSGLTNQLPYDVFITADSDGLKLSADAWQSATARASGALMYQDGVRVSGADLSRRYLGTFALNAAGKFEDSQTGRLLWNENNRITRPLLSKLVTSLYEGANHQGSWAPYYDDEAPEVRILVPLSDTSFELEGVGISTKITESDIGYGRGAAVGIGRDMMKESPFTGNISCVPIYTHTNGNGPVNVTIRNHNSGFQGYHTYTLAFWTNYSSIKPTGTSTAYTASGECPGLIGFIEG